MKSRTTAAILALLLGGLGMHRIYLGKWFTGILYLIFCWTYIPAVLGVIEGIYYLVSTDREFDKKYNPKPAVFQNGERVTPDTHTKCPDCAEYIKKEARVCMHCGCKIAT